MYLVKGVCCDLYIYRMSVGTCTFVYVLRFVHVLL